MKITEKNFIIIFISLFLLFTGCAHRKTMGVSPLDAGRETEVQAVQDPGTNTDVEEDELLDDFEEEFESKAVYVADPLYPFNYAMFHFNDKLYFWVLKPVAKGYKLVVPGVARTGVKNFFRNLATPVRLTSCLLQGKGAAAGNEFMGFFVNTTIGVLGFGDPAQKMFNLNLSDEDLGQTFGVYGIGNGFYIVWPFLGPSTLRDSVGMVGDSLLDPISYIEPPGGQGIKLFKMVNEISFVIGDYEIVKNAAIKPYEAFRDAYIQYRKAKIKK